MIKAKIKKRVVSRKRTKSKVKSKPTSPKQRVNRKKKTAVNNSSTAGKPAKIGRPFKKGKSGNPKGRPKGSKNKFSVALLQQALQVVEEKKRKTFLVKWIEAAWGDAREMANIANFMLPKLKSIEQITLPADIYSTDEIKEMRKEHSKRFETK